MTEEEVAALQMETLAAALGRRNAERELAEVFGDTPDLGSVDAWMRATDKQKRESALTYAAWTALDGPTWKGR